MCSRCGILSVPMHYHQHVCIQQANVLLQCLPPLLEVLGGACSLNADVMQEVLAAFGQLYVHDETCIIEHCYTGICLLVNVGR